MQATTHSFRTSTLERLHEHAHPYEDPNSTVERLLDLIENLASPAPPEGISSQPPTTPTSAKHEVEEVIHEFVSPSDQINLAFTKIGRVTIDGRTLVRPKWNSLMSELCRVAIEKHGVQWMIGRKAPRVVHGRSTTGGFHYMKESKASVQYTDSTKAWDYTSSLAQELGVCVEVEFFWRDKPEAAFPGERGRATVGCE